MLQDFRLDSAASWHSSATQRWPAAVALALTVGVVYFSSARLGLELQRHGVAVFWPAAGVSAGTLIALGPRARWSVAAGVIVANVAANLLGDRNLWGASIFSLADAGEAVLAAALIERWFAEPFELDRLSRVLGLLAAAPAAAAASGVIGTVGYVIFHPSVAPMLSIWYEWFVSDALGIVTVAPILIGFAAALRRPPRSTELIEGIIALALILLVSCLVVWDASGPWAMAVPLALSFPLMLWIGARCPLVFAAAASFIAITTINLTTTFGIGIFGDPALPVDERISAARAGTLAVASCALALAALFAERRQQEAALNQHIETQRVLVAELQHRTRNLMAVVQSIAHQTLENVESLADFEDRFNHRLEALSRVQSLLSRVDHGPITLGALVTMELDVLGSDAFGDRIRFGGPEAPLRKSAVEMLALAIHELLTNAIKHGALASNAGRLSITWQLERKPPGSRLVLQWLEHGIVSTPSSPSEARRSGYGRTLIEEGLPYSLGAETTFEFGADELRCVISLPLMPDHAADAVS